MPRALWLLLLPVLLVYGASLGFPYVWDDHHLIAGLGGPQAALGERLAAAIGPFLDVYFRPLTLSMIALELEAGSRASVVSHAVSVALFGMLVIGLVRWLKAEQISWPTAGLVGLVFATLPLATEAVLWVSARGDLLVAVFGVFALRETALRFPIRVDGAGEALRADGGRPVLLGVLVLGALLSKESGMRSIFRSLWILWSRDLVALPPHFYMSFRLRKRPSQNLIPMTLVGRDVLSSSRMAWNWRMPLMSSAIL